MTYMYVHMFAQMIVCMSPPLFENIKRQLKITLVVYYLDLDVVCGAVVHHIYINAI